MNFSVNNCHLLRIARFSEKRSLFAGEMEHHGFQSDVSHPCPSAPDYEQFYPHQPACGQPQPGCVQPSSHPCHTAVQLGEPALQHLQQIVLVVDGKPTTVYVSQVSPIPVSMVSAFVLSCLAFWLCGFLFGGIAFLLASESKRFCSANNISSSNHGPVSALVIILVFYLFMKFWFSHQCFI